MYYEGGPHIGELLFNIMLAFTLVGIPLAVGAFVRALWLRYRITDRRISITGGWMGRDRTDIIYSEIAKIVTVPRGLGAWGDMVVTLQKTAVALRCEQCPSLEIYSILLRINFSAG